uniref:Uncharacterized protein n=1 Tax=Brassica campestris TaxID=3711 RepID=A0A3P5YZP2_BRACM|nr:unnamed protein product [Brassica rapa]
MPLSSKSTATELKHFYSYKLLLFITPKSKKGRDTEEKRERERETFIIKPSSFLWI